jgi:hypothetical protein
MSMLNVHARSAGTGTCSTDLNMQHGHLHISMDMDMDMQHVFSWHFRNRLRKCGYADTEQHFCIKVVNMQLWNYFLQVA